MQPYFMSQHAQYRSAQRNLSKKDIQFILTNGKRQRGAGVIFCQLHHKNIPNDTPGNHRYRQLVGTTLVLCRCGEFVVTVYREDKAFHKDQCKARYNHNIDQAYSCPNCQ